MCNIFKRLGVFASAMVIMTALGCAESGTGDGTSVVDGSPTSPPPGQVEAGLVAVQSCGELETYIKSVAVSELDKGTMYYTTGVGAPPPSPAVDFGSDAAGGQGNEAPTSPTTGGSNGESGDQNGGPSYSDTNNQIAGVDEADLVKTNGNHIFTVDGQTLRIVKTLPAADSELVAELELAASPQELFLSGDTLLVYGRTWGE